MGTGWGSGGNTGLASQAGVDITTGIFYVIIGSHTGFDVTSGSRNTFVGTGAGANITTGDENVAIGDNCLVTGTATNRNVGVGHDVLEQCTGDHNTAIGHQAMKSNTSGITNAAVGINALYANTTGANNTAIGPDAGQSVTSGSNNTFLGHDAGRSNSPSGNVTTGSDVVCLGNNDVDQLFCADTSISSSDSRDKTDVTNFNIGLNWIKALRPVTYRWDRRTWYGTDAEPFGTPDGSKKRNRLHVGFLAQEALEVEKANGYGSSNDDSLLVNLTDDGMSYGIKYERLVPILVNAIKELETRLAAVEAA